MQGCRILLLSICCLLCALSVRAADKRFFYEHLCGEAELGWLGDPPLQGPVREVRLAQYAAARLPDGRLVKSEPPRAVYRAVLRFDAQGRGVRAERWSDFLGHDILENLPDGGATSFSSLRGARGRWHWRVRRDARGCPVQEDLYVGGRFVRTEERALCDGQGRKVYARNSLGQRRVWAYDARGNEALDEWFDYDEAGHMLVYMRKRAAYDDHGRPQHLANWKHLDPKRRALLKSDRDWSECGEDYDYDAAGRLVRVRPWHSEGARRVYEAASGQELEYDSAGRVTRRLVRQKMGAGVYSQENRYTYDAAGHPVAVVYTEDWPSRDDGPAEHTVRRLTFRCDSRGNWIWASRDDGRPFVFEREISYYPR